MTSRSFALDQNGKRIYVGSVIEYDNALFYVEDMNFSLSWSREHYLTLRAKNNRNKLLEFISSKDVLLKPRHKRRDR